MVKHSCLRTFYELEKTIGTGGFGKVKVATHILSGVKVAIKIVEKKCLGVDYPRIAMEFEALKNISHHHICQLYQFIETESHFLMVFEYCSGGELFDYIVQKTKLTEEEGLIFFRQIVSAVSYLHKQGYAHRDIKPENILLDKNMMLKLIDFGLCAKPTGGMNSTLKTSCGSPSYAAPELIKGNEYLGPEVDVWSLGVVLYALICGVLPFDDECLEGLYRKIISASYEEPHWISSECKSLIRSMLQSDPKNRITIEDISKHPWTTQNGKLPPVSSASLIEHRPKNRICIEAMTKHYCLSEEDMWNRLKKWQYNYNTATYLILLNHSNSGLPVSLRPRSTKLLLHAVRENRKVDNQIAKPKEACQYINFSGQKSEESSTYNRTPARTRRKRVHVEDDSPVPNKKTLNDVMLSKGSSMHTPKKSSTPVNKLMQSIEKKFHQVRDVVTPKKRKMIIYEPATISLKSVCNVSTTLNKDPNRVLGILKKFLDDMNIEYECKKGFRVHGKITKNPIGQMCWFELEVCFVKVNESEKVVGIRRKRLKGDSWAYKGLCEKILSLTQSK